MEISDTQRTKIVAQLDQIDRQAQAIEREGDQGALHARDIQYLCREIKLWFDYDGDCILF